MSINKKYTSDRVFFVIPEAFESHYFSWAHGLTLILTYFGIISRIKMRHLGQCIKKEPRCEIKALWGTIALEAIEE